MLKFKLVNLTTISEINKSLALRGDYSDLFLMCSISFSQRLFVSFDINSSPVEFNML